MENIQVHPTTDTLKDEQTDDDNIHKMKNTVQKMREDSSHDIANEVIRGS